MIKLSIKSKNNIDVNVSSKKTSFGTKMVKNIFVNYRFSNKGRTIVLSVRCLPLVNPCNDFLIGRMMEISDFLNEDVVGALHMSGVRLFHALMQNGKKVFENLSVRVD